MPCIFRGNQCHLSQQPGRPGAQILQIPNRRGDHVHYTESIIRHGGSSGGCRTEPSVTEYRVQEGGITPHWPADKEKCMLKTPRGLLATALFGLLVAGCTPPAITDPAPADDPARTPQHD